MSRTAAAADIQDMRRKRIFPFVLAVAATCSAGGLGVTAWQALPPAPGPAVPLISAAPASLSRKTAAPTPVVTQVTPPSTVPAPVPSATPAGPLQHPPDAVPESAVAEVQATGAAFAVAPEAAVQDMPSSVTEAVEVPLDAEKAAALVDAMNLARIENGLPPLAVDLELTAVAEARARDLVRNGYFDHYGPDGHSAFSELAARGIGYGLAGENLARNNYPPGTTVHAAFTGLMESPGHRANILEVRFNRVGVVAARSGRTWVYVTIFKD